MVEFSSLYDQEFFIIDSNNLHSVKSRLFGFSILNGDIVKNGDTCDNINQLGLGSYININVDDEKISIYQDFGGCWGLYLFKNGDYFAISNSFLKLVEYLNNTHNLSLNDDFAKSFMSTNFALIFRQTLVNEIEFIPRNVIINISKQFKEITYEKVDYELHTIPLNSEKALDILDSWFYRWINILRKLKEKTNNICFNIDGSFDTRILLIFALCANIDLDKIKFKTAKTPNFNYSDENYQIALEIANEFGFELNQDVFPVEKTYFDDINLILDLAFNIKLGFNTQMDYRFFRTKTPIYEFGAFAPEMIDYYIECKSFKEFVVNQLNIAKNMDDSFLIPVKKSLNNSSKSLMEEFNVSENESNLLIDLFFSELICRNHFNKLAVTEFFTNKILFTPFIDSEFCKLQLNADECSDKYLLYAIIFTRYFPKFFNFKFKGDKKILNETIRYANKINEIKPFKMKKFDYISGPPLNENVFDSSGKYDDESLENYLKDAFKSHGFKRDFINYFSEDIYEKILNSFETKNTQSLQNLCVSFQILKVINDITHDNKFKFSEWISYLLKRDHYHKISDIIPLTEKLNSKADIYHIHNNLNRNQILHLQYILEHNRVYKKIDFDISSNYLLENEKINLLNLNIIDFDDKKIEIDLDELQFIYDNQIIFSVKDSDLVEYNEELDYFELSTINLTPGYHELCLRYKDTYSDDVNIFIKNKYNLFDFDVWLSSDISNFDNFNAKSISLSNDWSDIGDCSVKVICDGKNNYQALLTPKMDVSVNSIVSVNVMIHNPKAEVIVRLFESSIASYVDMIVPASNIPKKVNFSKNALTDKMQLLLISRVKQIFYADNFEFFVIN